MRDSSFKDYILDQLTNLDGVHAKGMFSSFGLYEGDTFFGIISNGVLYLKTNQETKKRYVEAGMKAFQPNKKQLLKNYFEVPEEIIDDREEIEKWVWEAIDVGLSS